MVGDSVRFPKMTIVSFGIKILSTAYCADQNKQAGSPGIIYPEEALPPGIEHNLILE